MFSQIQGSSMPRNVPKHVQSSESSDTDSSSDDDDKHWKKLKRVAPMKCEESNAATAAVSTSCSNATREQSQKNPALKRNNIWSDVLQEDSISENIFTMDVLNKDSKIVVERQCESFTIPDFSADDIPDELPEMDCEARAPIKERLGVKLDDDLAEATILIISTALQEPKMDLISRVVEVLGREKALEYMTKTQDIEASGGSLTYDRTRRRKPGGIYFNLLKTDRDLPEELKRQIFSDERKRLEYMKRKVRATKRKIDVGKKRAKLDEEQMPPLPTVIDLTLQGITTKISPEETMESDRESGEISD